MTAEVQARIGWTGVIGMPTHGGRAGLLALTLGIGGCVNVPPRTNLPDAAVIADGAPPDAAPPDAAPPDAAPPDATPPDAAPPDALPLDAAPLDAAPLDAAPDAAEPDADPDPDPDAAGPDAAPDAGPPDDPLLFSDCLPVQSRLDDPPCLRVAEGAPADARLRRHAALALPDGRVVFTGGLAPPEGDPPRARPAARVAIYDPRANAWRDAAALGTARWGHALARFDDRVVVYGGAGAVDDGRWAALDAVEAMPDGLAGGWTPQAALDVPRAGATVARVGEEVWVIGGRAEWDGPPTAAVHRRPSLQPPELDAPPSLTVARAGHAQVELGGELMVFGGVGANGGAIDMLEVLRDGAWASTDVDRLARAHARVARVGDRVVFAGGRNRGLDAPDQLDAVPLSSTAYIERGDDGGLQVGAGQTMHRQRFDFALEPIGDGGRFLLAVGGEPDGPPEDDEVLVELYDRVANLWIAYTLPAPAAFPRRDHAAATVDGRVVVSGGERVDVPVGDPDRVTEQTLVFALDPID